MIILPIVNKNRVLNVEVKLRGAEKILPKIPSEDLDESDIIINGKKFSESSFSQSKDEIAIIDFLRSYSLLYKRNYRVSTKKDPENDIYDIYEVDLPPKKVHDALDRFYVNAVLDMQKEIPGSPKGRYLSFEKMGFNEILTEERITQVRQILSQVDDKDKMLLYLEKSGCLDLVQLLNFMQIFDCTVIKEASISEEEFQQILHSFEKLNTKDTKSLNHYYQMALSNRDIYAKMSYLYKLIYDQPFQLIQSESQKKNLQFVKKNTPLVEEGVSVSVG